MFYFVYNRGIKRKNRLIIYHKSQNGKIQSIISEQFAHIFIVSSVDILLKKKRNIFDNRKILLSSLLITSLEFFLHD
jgi:hypothetical protein